MVFFVHYLDQPHSCSNARLALDGLLQRQSLLTACIGPCFGILSDHFPVVGTLADHCTIYLLRCPPGRGKTTLAREMMRRFSVRGIKTMLVCSDVDAWMMERRLIQAGRDSAVVVVDCCHASASCLRKSIRAVPWGLMQRYVPCYYYATVFGVYCKAGRTMLLPCGAH